MTGADPTADTSTLLRQLARLDRRARLVALVNGLGITALALAVVVALALLADALWDVPLPLRIGFLSVAGVAAVVGGGWAFARAALRRGDPAAVAAMVESAYPQLHERLSSIMEWDRQDAGAGSPLMRELVVCEAQRGLRQLDVSAPLPLARATRRGTVGAGVLIGLLLPCLFFGGYRLLLERFATPWRNLERAANLFFVVEPGDATVSRGSDVEITAAPQWRVVRTQVDSATLHWQDLSGQRFARQMTWNADRAAFTATIDHVLQAFDFEVRSGRTQTRSYHVDVVDRPALASVTAIIEPPAYSGRAVAEIEGAVGDLELLRGSRLTLQMRFSLPIDRAVLLWTPEPAPDGPAAGPTEFPATVSTDRLAADVHVAPEESGRFVLQWHDAIGVASRNEPQRRVLVVADAPPQVRFADRRPTARAAPRDVLRLPVAAVDDIGLAALELHYQVVGDDRQTGVIPATGPVLGLRSVQEVFEFDLSALPLSEGSIVSIRSRAADERATPGPNEAWTEQRLVTISGQANPYESDKLAERQQELAQALQRLRATVVENRQTTETLRALAERHARAGTPFDRNADVAQLATADRETIVEAGRIAAMFDLHPLLESVRDRLLRVGREPLTSAEQSTAAANSAESAQKPVLLAGAHEQLLAAEEELAAIQRDLEHLSELEQDLLELQRLADDADRLAQDVAKLSKSDADAGDPAPGEEPDPLAPLRALAKDRLRTDHADLSRRLDDLLHRRPELLDSAAEHALEELSVLREQAQWLAARERGLAGAIEREQSLPAAAPDQAAGSASPYAELAVRQAELADRAAELAIVAAVAQNPAAQAVEEVARQAVGAAESIESGDLIAAAEAAQAAARHAEQSAAKGAAIVDPEQGGDDLLRRFAADQQALAQQMAELSAAPQARSDAQRQSQQRLTQRTQQLEHRFVEVAEQLTIDPLGRSDDGQSAAASGTATRAAREMMDASATARVNDDLPAAVTAAQQAASQLELAAEQSRSAVENSPDSPVPTEVGRQVAQASRQLKAAGKQLGDLPVRTESDEGADTSGSEGSDASAAQQQLADGETPMSEASDDASGEGTDTQMSDDAESSEVAKAAAALQAAAQRLKPRDPGDQQAPGETSAGQQPGGEPNSEAASEGAGTAETARLANLAARLKARSMRNWGELPGELQSELQQRSHGSPDAEYAPLIRLYFNEISRRQSPASREAP